MPVSIWAAYYSQNFTCAWKNGHLSIQGRRTHTKGIESEYDSPKNNKGEIRSGWLTGRARKRVDTRHEIMQTSKRALKKSGGHLRVWTSKRVDNLHRGWITIKVVSHMIDRLMLCKYC